VKIEKNKMLKNFELKINIPEMPILKTFLGFLEKHALIILTIILSAVSVFFFWYFLNNHLGLNYNDARSHLDIGRRVVEGLKPGLAQLGSVWLPLNHILMIPLIWNDWAWHSGFAGAFWSMLSFVGTGVLIYKILEKLDVGKVGRITGVVVFAANLNILYLQSTAMTELLLIGTMTAGSYYLIVWAKDQSLLNLIKASFWIMLSTLVRYDGWFLLIMSGGIVALITFVKSGYKVTEGLMVLFSTMAALGIVLWFLWNLVIFKDPLYFALGPFSAHTQQEQLLAAGNLPTKGNILLSTQVYLYALFYNSVVFVAILGVLGGVLLILDKKIKWEVRLTSLSLIAPFIFNVIALFLGFSVLFIQGISGNSWFNVRYGVMLIPSFAIFAGFLVEKLKDLRWVIIGIYIFVIFFALVNSDAVTLDDAKVGSSQKNVTEVSSYLKTAAKDTEGFILISAASHDAIIFSSGLPMSRFIHEGTGQYWEDSLAEPDQWARWIVMRTYDENDLTYKGVSKSEGLKKYHLVASYPFADVYEINTEYLGQLKTKPVLGKQK
jgi:hypothetical protein